MADMKAPRRDVKEFVRERYGALARSASRSGPAITLTPKESKGCCGPSATGDAFVRVKGLYSRDETKGLPVGALAASAGCGNPLALAEVRQGETVLDLGSGGGIDCLLAARRVGPTGRVIGIDMTEDMIALARRNAAEVKAANVEFRLAEMEKMPVDSASVDLIISNCVINLSPDKDAVFAEAYRALKPGGRVLISDIVTTGDIPAEVRASLDEWSHCIAGALPKDEYLAKMRAAGFRDVAVMDEKSVSNLTGWRMNLASIKVRAVKASG